MISLKFAALAGVTAAILVTPASASATRYIWCDKFNVSCVRVYCDDQTGDCSWANGYSDRYGTFMRSEYSGYYHSYGQWLCIRGDGCRGDIPPAVIALTPLSP